MKIQVRCRRSGEPRTLLLGARWLHVMSVLERAAENFPTLQIGTRR